jgi:dGTPase
MDWSDDIAYSAHDVEDYFRAGLIPLDRLASSGTGQEAKRFLQAATQSPRIRKVFGQTVASSELEEPFRQVMGIPPGTPYDGTHVARSLLSRWKSERIQSFLDGLSLDPNADPYLRIPPEHTRRVALLKELTWFYVINNPATAAQRMGQRTAIQCIFKVFKEAAIPPGPFSTEDERKEKEDDEWVLFSPAYKERMFEARAQGRDDGAKVRIVIDFIASLSEAQALAMYHRLTGTSLGSVLHAAAP